MSGAATCMWRHINIQCFLVRSRHNCVCTETGHTHFPPAKRSVICLLSVTSRHTILVLRHRYTAVQKLRCCEADHLRKPCDLWRSVELTGFGGRCLLVTRCSARCGCAASSLTSAQPVSSPPLRHTTGQHGQPGRMLWTPRMWWTPRMNNTPSTTHSRTRSCC